MGLGKTVQVAALLMALFGKCGRKNVDKPACRIRSRIGYNGGDATDGASDEASRSSGELCPPCLIIGPASVMTNWYPSKLMLFSVSCHNDSEVVRPFYFLLFLFRW